MRLVGLVCAAALILMGCRSSHEDAHGVPTASDVGIVRSTGEIAGWYGLIAARNASVRQLDPLSVFLHRSWRAFHGPPRDPNGASLLLDVRAFEGARLLDLRLELSAGQRTILGEAELPFLFAIRADGRPVTSTSNRREEEAGVELNSRGWKMVERGERRSWQLLIDAWSLERLLPLPLPERVDLVAACLVWEGPALRSNVVALERRDGRWRLVH